ncbi:TRAP transporter small permease [Cochlodiniinecator piscidefendens]|uniref:TRAP transporter small permease n=1 Tax=Cochlodiniinecator piscidefendens TaxID=2715756 RepID=UPI00140A6478|nr:TRAP transporter small permease [Cochlodiniinecator piscidefendens]
MHILGKIERAIAFCCCLFLASVFCLVVLMRYVFETDLFAYEEWVLTVAFLLYFIGGALASRTNTHIKADIFLEYIRTERAKKRYEGIIQLVEAVIVALIAWYASKMFINEFARWPNIPTSPVYKIPLALPRFFIVMGFVLMALHAFVNGVRNLREAREMKSDIAAKGN